MTHCASSSNRPSRIVNRFAQVFITYVGRKKNHKTVIRFLIRSKAPIVSSLHEKARSTDRIRYFPSVRDPPRFMSVCRSLSCKWTFKVSRAHRDRYPPRKIDYARRMDCTMLHCQFVIVIAESRQEHVLIINLVGELIDVRSAQSRDRIVRVNQFNRAGQRKLSWFSVEDIFSLTVLFYTWLKAFRFSNTIFNPVLHIYINFLCISFNVSLWHSTLF